jgi:hypothetical protein
MARSRRTSRATKTSRLEAELRALAQLHVERTAEATALNVKLDALALAVWSLVEDRVLEAARSEAQDAVGDHEAFNTHSDDHTI